ncbi:MAG: hypothetical protein IID39_06980, partial [Planctomycetes bacterium]|nr:hypothetical protein [Planctomycetota bacterium]
MQLSRLGRWIWGLTACAALVFGVGVASVNGATPQSSGLDPEVAAAFGLDDGTVVSIDMDRTPNVPVTIVVPINGTDYALNLSPHSVRTDDFVFLVQVAGGSLEERDPGPIRTLRGTIEGLSGSSVAGSMLETGLVASIEMPDGDVFWIEPLASKMPHADRDLFVVYHSDDARSPDGQCGVTEAMLANVARIELEPDEPEYSSGGVISVAELGIDADVEYFNRWGSEQGTRDRIELVINTMNEQYERDVELIHLITTIIIRTSEPDPYSSRDPETLLFEFLNHWNSNQGAVRRDTAHLFTGKNLFGNVIGIAFLGVICNRSSAYGLVQSDCCGGLRWATDLSAHEIGHNWNADHCNCPGWTMHTALQGANKFHANFTIPEVIAFRNSRGCLDVLGSVTLPFLEEWPTQTFDIFKWVETAGVSISTGGSNEPSAPFAALLNSADTLESREIDASGVNPAGILNFSFYLEEKFTEGNDTFFADYQDSEG